MKCLLADRTNHDRGSGIRERVGNTINHVRSIGSSLRNAKPRRFSDSVVIGAVVMRGDERSLS